MKKHRILLAEDNGLSAELASFFLEEAGYEYRVARNGEEALSLLSSETFDVVLMDVEMPVMDGLTASLRIRSVLDSNIPVIALSGHMSEHDKKRCTEAGMNDYVIKPFQKETLCSVIAKQLGKEAAATYGEAKRSHSLSGNVTDLTYLRSIANGNDHFFTSMIRLFTEQVPKDIARLKEAMHECDYETIRTLAHKIKTSVVFVGTDPHVRMQLAEMEKLGECKKGILRIAELFTHVRRTCSKACNELMPLLVGEQLNSSH